MDTDNTPGIFYNIRKLSVGDRFEITNQGRRYIYEVRENKTFMVWDDPSNVLVHKENDWVTLLTCEDYSENTDSYLKRRVVIGELVSIK